MHHVYADPAFDPELWELAFDGDTFAGYVGARVESEEDPSLGTVGLLVCLPPTGVAASARRCSGERSRPSMPAGRWVATSMSTRTR